MNVWTAYERFIRTKVSLRNWITLYFGCYCFELNGINAASEVLVRGRQEGGLFAIKNNIKQITHSWLLRSFSLTTCLGLIRDGRIVGFNVVTTGNSSSLTGEHDGGGDDPITGCLATAMAASLSSLPLLSTLISASSGRTTTQTHDKYRNEYENVIVQN